MKYLSIVAISLSVIIFFGCSNTDNTTNDSITNNKNKTEDINLVKGKQIVQKAQSTLGKNLMKTIQSKGVLGAMDFCSAKAMLLTDSLSKELNVMIKRVSDKNRNPQNIANDIELNYITEAKQLIANGKKPLPHIIDNKNNTISYYPIMTNKACLKCHGEKNIDIKANVVAKIDSLYPADKAIDYKENELRGIWVLEMTKQ